MKPLLNDSELGLTAMEIVVFLCPIVFPKTTYLLLSVKEFLCFEEKQMNDILLEVMEWLIYHSIEIILLILCVIGWKLWWEVS